MTIRRWGACLLTATLALGLAPALGGTAGSVAFAASTCSAPQTWQVGRSYALGDVVVYPGNGRTYKVVNVNNASTEATDPTVSTWYWQSATCPTPAPSANRFVGGYYPWWVASPMRLSQVDANYSLVYLFAATAAAGDTSGAVGFHLPADVNGAATHWSADIQTVRRQGRTVMLSVGGAGHAMAFPNRAVSQRFVDSVDRLYGAWGGFDGIDLNTFEGSQAPDTSEMIWIARELKRRHPGFLISAPPAPWNPVDLTFCKDMLAAGALDWCAPQYYDGPDLASPAYVKANIERWMAALGPAHVAIGLGIDPSTPSYESVASATTIWDDVEARYPKVRGAFNWQIASDAARGYPFARRLGPLVRH